MADNVTKLNKEQADGNKTKLPSREELYNLLKSYTALTADMDETRGELGALLKNADNQKNIHRGAFKLAAKIKRMTSEKAEAFLTHFDHYRAQFGLDDGRTAPLPFDAAKTAAE